MKSIVMVSAETRKPIEIQSIPLIQNTVYLKAACNFKDKTDHGYFYYSLDGKTWESIGKKIKMEYLMPHFMGYRFALFNYATIEAGGYVDFDWFRISTEM